MAIPLVAFDADYYAVLDLVEVERTLDSLQFVLLGAGAAPTLWRGPGGEGHGPLIARP